MNEEKRTQWVKKDPELTAWWRSTGMRSMREFTRKYAKELDVKIKDKALGKVVKTSVAEADAKPITPEERVMREILADPSKVG